MPLYPMLVKSLPEKISQCNARGIAANQLGFIASEKQTIGLLDNLP